jgi:hypothetical protein
MKLIFIWKSIDPPPSLLWRFVPQSKKVHGPAFRLSVVQCHEHLAILWNFHCNIYYRYITTLKLLTWTDSSLIQTINRNSPKMRNECIATIIRTVTKQFFNKFASSFCIEISFYTMKRAISCSVLWCHPVSLYGHSYQ